MNKDKKQIAFELYRDSNGEILLKDIAEKVGASPGTVRTWKSRDKWDELIGATKNETQRNVTRNATEEKEIPKAVIELNNNSDLTEQQKLFCLYYLQSFNATQSYIKAYNAKYNVANVEGPRLLVKPSIKKELDRLKLSLQSSQYFTIQDIIDDYAKQWKTDINDVVTSERKRFKATDSRGKHLKDEQGNQIYTYYNTVTAKNSDEFDGRMVKEITQGRDGVSVKLWDKQKAMDALVKLLPNEQLRKLKAEADILENKASKLTDDTHVDELLEALINPQLALEVEEDD